MYLIQFLPYICMCLFVAHVSYMYTVPVKCGMSYITFIFNIIIAKGIIYI